GAACRSVTGATSSTRAATPPPAPARSWPRTPRSSSSTSALSLRTSRPIARTASRTLDTATGKGAPNLAVRGPLSLPCWRVESARGGTFHNAGDLGNVVAVVLVDPDERRGR